MKISILYYKAFETKKTLPRVNFPFCNLEGGGTSRASKGIFVQKMFLPQTELGTVLDLNRTTTY